MSLLEKHCKKYEIPLVEISEDLHYWGIIRYVIMQVFDKATAVPFLWASYGFGTPAGYAGKIDSFEDLLKL